MNRRSFFKLLGGAAAGVALEPVARSYFFAPKAGWGLEKRNVFLITELETFDASFHEPLSASTWSSKSAEEILRDVNSALLAHWAYCNEGNHDVLNKSDYWIADPIRARGVLYPGAGKYL